MLEIKIERDAYYAGEIVRGNIFVGCSRKPSSLEISISGTEDLKFLEKNDLQNGGYQSRTRKIEKPQTYESHFDWIKHSKTIKKWKPQESSGKVVVPFLIKLPL